MARNTVMSSGRRSSTGNRRQSIYEEQGTAEFEGIYLNPGIWIASTDEEGNDIPGTERFARLNKGVALSDLLVQKVYENTRAETAEEVLETNEIVEALREKAPELAEGEMVVVNVSCVLYRKQEGVELSAKSAKDKAKRRKELFG